MMIWSLSYDSLEKIEVLLFKRKLQIQNFSRSSTGRTKHNVTGHVSLEISVFVCVCLSICMSVCQWWLSSHGHRTQFQRQFNCSAVCLSVCLSVCLCVSGGCRLTVTGHNFNVSSTALLSVCLYVCVSVSVVDVVSRWQDTTSMSVQLLCCFSPTINSIYAPTPRLYVSFNSLPLYTYSFHSNNMNNNNNHYNSTLCVSAYLWNRSTDPHEMFYADPLWPWLGAHVATLQ